MGGWGVGHGYDIDPWALAVHPDAERLDVRRLPAVTSGGIVASPPCQDYSLLGRGTGRRMLHRLVAAVDAVTPTEVPAVGPTGARLTLELARHRPDWLCAEQVPEALPVYEAIARRLASEGYQVWAGVVSAEQFGVPQTRRRAVLLASRTGLSGLKPTHGQWPSHHPRPAVTMAAALAPFGPPWTGPGWWHRRPAPTVLTKNSLRAPTGSLPLSVPEMAALQQLPPPPVPRTHAYRLIGNAIPSGLARALVATVAPHAVRPADRVGADRGPQTPPAQRPQR